MRRQSVFVGRGDGLDVKMTPMIDVVFLLLIFFVWTASFQIVEYMLPSRLSVTSGSAEQTELDPEMEDFDRVVVRVLWDEGRPVFLVNETARDNLAEVRDMLETLAQIKSDAPVILDPDQAVPLGQVIDVYDVARLVGFEKIQFAASEEI